MGKGGCAKKKTQWVSAGGEHLDLPHTRAVSLDTEVRATPLENYVRHAPRWETQG